MFLCNTTITDAASSDKMLIHNSIAQLFWKRIRLALKSPWRLLPPVYTRFLQQAINDFPCGGLYPVWIVTPQHGRLLQTEICAKAYQKYSCLRRGIFLSCFCPHGSFTAKQNITRRKQEVGREKVRILHTLSFFRWYRNRCAMPWGRKGLNFWVGYVLKTAPVQKISRMADLLHGTQNMAALNRIIWKRTDRKRIISPRRLTRKEIRWFCVQKKSVYFRWFFYPKENSRMVCAALLPAIRCFFCRYSLSAVAPCFAAAFSVPLSSGR